MGKDSHAAPEHVAVVGAGMVGLATAWFLQEQGVRVTVVDRTGPAAGASWGNAGLLTPAFTLPLPEPAVLRYGVRAFLDRSSPVSAPLPGDRRLWRFLTEFAVHCTPGRWRRAMDVFNQANRLSLDAYDRLVDGGITAPVKQAEPFLVACTSRAGRAPLLEEFDRVAATGAELSYDLLDGGELREQEPILSADARAGVRVHGQRFVNPPEFVHALADAVRARGGEVRSGCHVRAVHDLGTRGVELAAAPGEGLRADAVVLANGAWLNGLARPFGVRRVVQPGRGYSFSIQPEAMPRQPIYLPQQRISCNPLGDRFRVTGMMEFRAAEAGLDPRKIHTVVDSARGMFCGVDWNARREEWVGSRPCTADGLPLVGASTSPRVRIAGGHGMWGMVLGPLTGRLLAESMTTGATPPLLRHFDPLR